MGNGYSRIRALWEQGLLRPTARKAASAVGSPSISSGLKSFHMPALILQVRSSKIPML
jgi:hypothetical protein